MSKETVIFIIWFSAYVIMHMFFTQIIYSKNLIKYCILVSILICVSVFFLSEKSKSVELTKIASIYFWYLLLLLVIKKGYRFCNTYLIKWKLVDKKFSGKTFTFVEYGDFGDLWDEKLATKPSWFDSVLSLLLFILPLLFIRLLS
ncbi:MAG: hypothetical protein KA319_04175 [Ferruginibacter sp.]|nr:hypothetical protein [Ferruginibacter sp.]